MKKLKRIIKRIKHWLIRRLGGYTEQKVYKLPPIEYTRYPIRTLEGTYSVPMERLSYMSAAEIEEWCCRYIADDLSKHLVERQAVEIMSAEDPFGGVKKFKWRLRYVERER